MSSFNGGKLSQDRREKETFRRLNRLVACGYVAQLGSDGVEDAIWLDHLADGPQLILFAGGMVASTADKPAINFETTDDDHKDRIFNETFADIKAFDLFLASLRQPNWLERTRPARKNTFGSPVPCFSWFSAG